MRYTSLQSIVGIPNLNMREVMVVCTLTNTYVYRVNSSEPPALLLKLEKVKFKNLLEKEINSLISKDVLIDISSSNFGEIRGYFQVEAVSSHMTTSGQNLLAIATSTNNILVYDAVNGEQLFTGSIPEKDPAPIKFISFVETSKEYEFAVVLEDCRFIYLVGSSNKLAREWIRHEALSTITSVEMVDLPLSEAQADIESEFASDDGLFNVDASVFIFFRKNFC